MSTYEAELEYELEAESQEQEFEQEQESEHEHEHEQESEAFFNHLAAMGDRGGRAQSLRRIALAAARQALRDAPKPAAGIEGEFEFEQEGAFELELEMNPGQRQHLEAELEHIAHAAAEAAHEQEAAERFLPLIPLAAKVLLPMAAKALPMAAKLGPRLIGRVAPQLTRGVGNIARALFRSPQTRPLLNALPRIARGTIGQLARRVGRGQKITPRYALQTLARQTARTLSNPRRLAQTYRRSVALDRRFHRGARRVIGGLPPAQRRAARPAPSGAGGTWTGPRPGVRTVPTGAAPAPVAPGYGTGRAPRAGGCRCCCCGCR